MLVAHLLRADGQNVKVITAAQAAALEAEHEEMIGRADRLQSSLQEAAVTMGDLEAQLDAAREVRRPLTKLQQNPSRRVEFSDPTSC